MKGLDCRLSGAPPPPDPVIRFPSPLLHLPGWGRPQTHKTTTYGYGLYGYLIAQISNPSVPALLTERDGTARPSTYDLRPTRSCGIVIVAMSRYARGTRQPTNNQNENENEIREAGRHRAAPRPRRRGAILCVKHSQTYNLEIKQQKQYVFCRRKKNREKQCEK